MSDRTFYPSVIAFFSGVFAFSYADFSFALLAFALAAIACLSLVCIAREDRRFHLSLCVLAVFILGGSRVEMSRTGEHPLDENEGLEVALKGKICDEPVAKDATQRFCFSPEGISDRILVTASRYPAYGYGDVASIQGKLELPRNFQSYEGGPEFDYVSYLAKDRVRYTMYLPDIEAAGMNEGSAFRKFLYGIKSAFISKMKRLYPEPEASLLSGILLGDRSSIPKDVRDDFAASGLVHILVLSGYNVAIVADTIMKACAFLPRFIGLSLGGFSIIAFALMTGAGATTVRAAIMALVVVGSRFVRRRYDVSRALMIAAAAMVVHNPMILAFDVSFQLSFLATIAVVYAAPIVSAKVGFITERWNLREIVATTIGTQIFLFPFLAYSMGQVSLVSLVTNILALPLVPYAMLGGFVSSTAAFVSDLAALPVAWASSSLLSYLLGIAENSARLSFASLHMRTSAFALVVIYAIYACYIVRATISVRQKSYSLRSAS